MIFETNKVTIVLETQEEIESFWNVISFAQDLNAKEHCFNEHEKKMADKLVELTSKYYNWSN